MPNVGQSTLEYLFHPRSITIIGVSADTTRWNAGQRFVGALLDAGFDGAIYPVNPGGGEILGLKIYPSLRAIPGVVDYVISAVPAQHTLQLIAECGDKGVKAVHIFAAGFSETGESKGKELEEEVANLARQRGVRIIGPNCMGLYCPETRLSFRPDFPRQRGPVGLVSQSGGNTVYAVLQAAMRGVHFSKVVSYGNACDLSETDFLEYLTGDPETKIIAAYIEGIEDGAHFIKVLKRATEVKPVVIFKGGTTEAGAKTAASHTSAMAGSDRIWSSLLWQAGAIRVNSIEELIDVALLFIYMSSPKGRSTAVIGLGGGASVQAADTCSEAGLTLPPLPAEIRQRLREVSAGDAGRIFGNPLDFAARGNQDLTEQAIRIVANSDQIDLLIIHVPFDLAPLSGLRDTGPYIDSLVSLAKEINRRTAVVLHYIILPESRRVASEAQATLSKAGFPVYPSVSRAANAISKFIQYHHN